LAVSQTANFSAFHVNRSTFLSPLKFFFLPQSRHGLFPLEGVLVLTPPSFPSPVAGENTPCFCVRSNCRPPIDFGVPPHWVILERPLWLCALLALLLLPAFLSLFFLASGEYYFLFLILVPSLFLPEIFFPPLSMLFICRLADNVIFLLFSPNIQV